MTALLVVVVAGMSWAAYTELRRATLGAAEEHLRAASSEIATMLGASLRRIHGDATALAHDPRISHLARIGHASPGDTAAITVFDSVRAHTPQVRALSVWTREGALVGSVGSAAEVRASHDALADPRPDGVSPIFAVGDTLAFAVMAPIQEATRDTVGYLISARAFGDPSSSAAISKLLGVDARLLLGNHQGDMWTDLARRVENPATHARDYVSVSAPIAMAPWILRVDQPVGVALRTVRAFVAQLVAVALLFVLAGAVAVWLIIVRALRPLDDLHHAAESLSVGGSPVRVTVRGGDEISGLAKAFNLMAESIRAAGQELVERAETLERSNQALKESERRYRQLVDQAPDAVIVHRDGRILFANTSAARVLGARDVQSLVGCPLFDFVDDVDRAAAVERAAAIAASGLSSKPTPLHLRRLDGKTVLAEASGALVQFDGAPAVQTLARDVSERRLLEDQLMQAQKMEAVGRLAGGIAHDFNNLLTIINTYSEFLLSAIPSDDARRADVEEIRRAVASATRLTRQMLTFSRRQVVAPVTLDLNEAIAGMAGMLARVLGDDVRVDTELQAGSLPLLADAGQLEQVLLNLAVNARDAMPRGGRLCIETGQVTLDDGFEAQGHQRIIPAGHYVMLAVSDTGGGMTDDVKSHIFEPFFTTKGPGRGTGLGLATVYGIVKQSGGHIWVYSEPNRGTSVKIYFPLHAAAPESSPARLTGEFPIPSRDAATLLLVEDDAMVRGAVRRILERSPHAILEAATPAEAIELFTAHRGRIDLVVTDMMMPELTGAELIRELRERNPHLRAIIMSGYSEAATSRDWRLPPNALFLEKPIAPNKLLRCIADVLAGDFGDVRAARVS